MNIKIPLITGLIFIVAGLAIKILNHNILAGNILIVSGIISKLVFLIISLQTKAYKPNIETLFLLAGLLVFLTGMIFRELTLSGYIASILLASGVTLKLVFIILFFEKFKSNNHV